MLPLTWPHRFTYLVYVSRKQLNNYNSFFGIMNHSAIGTLAIDIWLKVVGSHFDASEYLQIPHTKSLYFCRWSACWMIDGTRYWCIWNLNCICSVDFFVGWIPPFVWIVRLPRYPLICSWILLLLFQFHCCCSHYFFLLAWNCHFSICHGLRWVIGNWGSRNIPFPNEYPDTIW